MIYDKYTLSHLATEQSKKKKSIPYHRRSQVEHRHPRLLNDFPL